VTTTNIGQYLYATRIRRDYESISDYLKNYADIPISESYYRDIESGRKLIRLDTAEMLCQALKLEKTEFFFQLLRDLLPTDVADSLLKPIPNTAFQSPSEEFERQEQDITLLRKAYEKRLVQEPYIVDAKVVNFLDANFNLLPLIHFIYLREQCTFKELKEVIEKSGITQSFEQVINDFEEYHIASVGRDTETITRYSKSFRIPRNNTAGVKFKDRFLKSEIEKTLGNANREQKIGPNGDLVYSTISSFKSQDGLEKISTKLSELIAQIEVEESPERDATPYFLTVVFSSREEYSSGADTAKAKKRLLKNAK